MTAPFPNAPVEKVKENGEYGKQDQILPPNYVIYYVKLLNQHGNDYAIHSFQIPVNQNIGALEFGTIERGDKPYRPLVRTPFYMHDDLKRLHTICSRIPDGNDDPEAYPVSNEITEVEW